MYQNHFQDVWMASLLQVL